MRRFHGVLAVLALLVVAGSAQAQRFGAHVNLGLDSDLGLGGRVELDMANKLSQTGPLSKAFFVGQLDYYFDTCGVGDCTMFEINPGLLVPVGSGRMDFYAGGGLNIARASAGGFSNTETGVNIIGGLRFPMSGFSAYAEGRLGLGGADQLALTFGIKFGKGAGAN